MSETRHTDPSLTGPEPASATVPLASLPAEGGWYEVGETGPLPGRENVSHALHDQRDGVAEKRAKKAEADAAFMRQRHQAERDLREHTENKLRAQKGATTRAKKRHAAALCPCCNRSFVQLRRHLATQHPEYSPGAEG